MREADDRRRRHARALRDFGDRAERDVGRMIEHEFGDLLQPAGQRAVPLRDRAAQFVVGHRGPAGLFMVVSLPSIRPIRHLDQIFHFTAKWNVHSNGNKNNNIQLGREQ